MNFDWTKRPVAEWHGLLKLVPRSNYLQSLPHARAAGVHDRKNTRYGLIKIGGETVGLLALQEIKLGPIHVVDLYRGPLWLVEDPPVDWLQQFVALFDRTFPRRWLRRRRWLPEWQNSAEVQAMLQNSGFRSNGESYETICLDLTKSLPVLRDEMKGKWRNALVKGEKQNLTIKTDTTGATAGLFLAQYDADRRSKGYHGRSVRFLTEEIKAALSLNEGFILWAYYGVAPIAGIFVLIHGQTATYRVGWTTHAGRRCNAHNVLLWEAIKHLQRSNVTQFDLGGVEPQTAAGLTSFKKGLGGRALALPGIYQ